LDDSTLKALAELRESLTSEIIKLQEKINELQSYVDALDIVLKKNSFTTAADLVGMSEPDLKTSTIRTIDIKTPAFGSLAKVQVYPDKLIILPEKGVRLNTNLGPFTKFLVKKIFENKKVSTDHKKQFNYTIDKDADGILEKIIISNYGSNEDLNKLIGAIRWTFEKIKE